MNFPLLSTLTIDIIRADCEKLSAGHTYTTRGDAFARLYHIIKGDFHVKTADLACCLKPDELFLLPAGKKMTYTCKTDVQIAWMHLNANILSGIDIFAFLRCKNLIGPVKPALADSLMFEMITNADPSNPTEFFKLQSTANRLIALITADCDYNAQARTEPTLMRFRPVLEYIDQNLSSPIKLSQLADIASLEQAYFSRLFKSCFNTPPLKYVTARKIDRASKLLLSTDLTLSQIADRLAFSDAFHLSNTFKKVTGSSPARFRKRSTTPTP